MEAFLQLAGQLLIIICVQSILEILASTRRQYHLHKIIFLGAYAASLVVVFRFMYRYIAPLFARFFQQFM